MASGEFRIGQFATRHGVTSATLRYYERLGLMAAPVRTPAGYRVYGPADDARLRFVLRLKGLGLSLEDIATVVRGGEVHGQRAARMRLQELLVAKAGDARRQARAVDEFADRLMRLSTELDQPVGEAEDPDGRGSALGFDADLDAELARIDD